ncbi:MAG: c-type cytochrome biogenesis protein CcmI [bacterium]
MIIWIIAAAMVGVALVILLAPMLRKASGADIDRQAQNIAIAREQLAALEQDLAEGRLERAEYEVSKNELEQALASNLEASVDAGVILADRPKSKLGVLMVGVFVPLFSIGMYAIVGNPEMASADGAPQPRAEAGKQDVDVEAMLATLKSKLEEKPDNLKGWLMLGRSYMVLERYPLAVDAYARADELSPNQPEIMLPLADALAMQSNGQLQGEPERLIRKVLEIDPENEMGLWLSGMAAKQSGDDKSALAAWQKLYAKLPPGSPDQEEVGRLVAELGGTPVSGQTSVASAAEGITVTVDLPEAEKVKVKDDELVFVYAKAMQGPPMPLAAVRKQVRDLPVTLILDDSMAMMPQMKLSGFDRVKVGARVSRSGGPIAQSGDLFAEQENVQAGDKVELTINKTVP